MAKIAEVDRTFDLIMVTELFDESLVLLRDLLCWTYEDISYLKVNALRSNAKTRLSPAARERLKEWLWGDVLFYEHFRENLERRLDQYGRDKVRQGVDRIRTVNQGVRNRKGRKERSCQFCSRRSGR